MFKRYQMDYLIDKLNSLYGPSYLKDAGIIKNESVKYNANRIIGNLMNDRNYVALHSIVNIIEQRTDERIAYEMFRITFNKVHALKPSESPFIM